MQHIHKQKQQHQFESQINFLLQAKCAQVTYSLFGNSVVWPSWNLLLRLQLAFLVFELRVLSAPVFCPSTVFLFPDAIQVIVRVFNPELVLFFKIPKSPRDNCVFHVGRLVKNHASQDIHFAFFLPFVCYCDVLVQIEVSGIWNIRHLSNNVEGEIFSLPFHHPHLTHQSFGFKWDSFYFYVS